MDHVMIELQTALMASLRGDSELTTLIDNAIFDAPPRGAKPPYISIARHDVRNRDVDLSPGFTHEMTLYCRALRASRADALMIAARVVTVAMESDLSTPGFLVTHRHHTRTDSAVDLSVGQARATVMFKFLSEPVA